MITVLDSLNFLNSEKYKNFVDNLKKNININIESTVYNKILQSELSEINHVDIRMMDFKDIISEKNFFEFSIGRIKIDEENYKKYIKKEIEKNEGITEYGKLDKMFEKKYRRYFLFHWITDYYFLLKGNDEFLERLKKRDIPLIEEYVIEISEIFKKISN